MLSLHETRFISIKSFLVYVTCKLKKAMLDKMYKTYVCNCLNSISINTAKQCGGKKVEKSYVEVIKKIEKIPLYSVKKPKPKNNVDNIIACTVARCGFKFKNMRGGKQNGFI